MNLATLVRPPAVILAQIKANWLCWTRATRIVTYTDGLYLGPLTLKLLYLQIELEDGTILYRTPYLPDQELQDRIGRLRRLCKLTYTKTQP